MVVGQIAQEKDVIVIGGGPGGYTAAIRAAQLGRDVTLIEVNQIGGICLNQGCIPSKVFAQAASKMKELSSLKNYGIELNDYHFNYDRLVEQKGKTVKQLRKGVEALCKSNKIEIIKGTAMFLSNERIGVEQGDAYELFTFNAAIIATGATPRTNEQVTIDQVHIVDDYGLYNLSTVPNHLVIYGSNYIALEAATTYKALGSEVTVVLEQDGFGFDESIEKELQRQLKKSKIKVMKDMKLQHGEAQDGIVRSTFIKKGEETELESSHLYVASTYLPNVQELGLDRIGVKTDRDGWIAINFTCATSVPNIFAVGDVTGGELLAVKSIKQGKVAAEAICERAVEWDGNYLPKIAHSYPPIASVGLSEKEAIEQGYNYSVGNFPLSGNGYSSVKEKRDGLIKVISEKDTDRILGIHILGEGAVELISAGINALEMVARTDDLSYPYYPHPSMNEALLEAVEDLTGLAIHKPNK